MRDDSQMPSSWPEISRIGPWVCSTEIAAACSMAGFVRLSIENARGAPCHVHAADLNPGPQHEPTRTFEGTNATTVLNVYIDPSCKASSPPRDTPITPMRSF